MATVQELMKLGEQMNLTGADLKEFVREQQTLAREEREKERTEKEKEREREERGKEKEREEREKDRQFEIERMKFIEASKRLELQAKLENPRDRSHVIREDDDQEEQEATSGLPSFTDHRARGPKMTAFDKKDDMGSSTSV